MKNASMDFMSMLKENAQLAQLDALTVRLLANAHNTRKA